MVGVKDQEDVIHIPEVVGAPSSGLIAEFFLQHTENTHLARLSHKHRIIETCSWLRRLYIHLVYYINIVVF